jgi:hypothetical protein
LTAIVGLERLEAPGIWRPEAAAERRAVYVAIGEAELVVQDPSGTALAHWSLPALVRRDRGGHPAVYAPDPLSDETLEIEEEALIEALDRVVAAVEKGRRRTGRLRRAGTGIAIVGAAGLAALLLPDLGRDQAANMLPPSARSELGERMLAHIVDVAGPPCASPTGSEALESLRDRLLPLSRAAFHVVPDLPRAVMALPGDHYVISAELLADQDDPEIVAGHVLAAVLASKGDDPVEAMLAALGPLSLARLLATGEVPHRALRDHAERLLLMRPPAPDPDELRQGFAAARLGWDAWAAAAGLPAAGDAPPMPPAMDDATWQALRAICDV